MAYKAYIHGAGAKFYVDCDGATNGQQLKVGVLAGARSRLVDLSSFELYFGKTVADPPPEALLVDIGTPVAEAATAAGIAADRDGSLHFFAKRFDEGACVCV